MAEKNYLIFDFGASGGRAILGTFDGNSLALTEIHRFDNRPVRACGTLYWDVLRLFSELKAGILIALQSCQEIAGLGIDTWGVDFGFIDRDGKLIANPIHYRDKLRSQTEPKLYEVIPKKELFKLTGGVMIQPVHSIFNLYSLKLRNATEFVNADKFLMMPDIFNFLLTGEARNEFTNATLTVMYNLIGRRWEDRILGPLGIPADIFPELVQPGTQLGNISADQCRDMGINAIPVIVPATWDAASAEAAIPLSNTQSNVAFGNIGTWCNIGVETEKPLVNADVLESGFGNLGGVDRTNQLTKSLTGLWIVQQCREKWIRDADKQLSWDEIGDAASSAPPLQAVVDVNAPEFLKPQVDMTVALREYCRRTRQSVPQGVPEFARCIYESIAMKFRQEMNVLQRLTGRRMELLHVVGGGTQNRLLCQWICDALGIPVAAGPVEATSVGNMIMQMIATGELSDLRQGRELVRNSFEILRYEPANTDAWNEAYGAYLNTCSYGERTGR